MTNRTDASNRYLVGVTTGYARPLLVICMSPCPRPFGRVHVVERTDDSRFSIILDSTGRESERLVTYRAPTHWQYRYTKLGAGGDVPLAALDRHTDTRQASFQYISRRRRHKRCQYKCISHKFT